MFKSYKPGQQPPARVEANDPRRQEFAAGHDDARPDLKVDYVYEGHGLESNYLRNRYGGDDD
jgi:hypothetical protein